MAGLSAGKTARSAKDTQSKNVSGSGSPPTWQGINLLGVSLHRSLRALKKETVRWIIPENSTAVEDPVSHHLGIFAVVLSFS